MQPWASACVLAGVRVRAFFVSLTLLTAACGAGDEPDDEPGLETGPCLSGQQCAAGLVCASEVCVDLGGSDGSGGPADPASGSQPASGGNADAGDDADTAMDDANPGDDGSDPGMDDPPPTDDGANGGADDGPAAWCPVPPASLACATVCDLFQYECYECPNEPGDLCTYYDYQYEACLSGCEYAKTTPEDFTYEAFACRQYAGNDCGDAHVDCLLEIDCSGG